MNTPEYDEEGSLVDPGVQALREVLYASLSPNYEIEGEGYDQAAFDVMRSDWFRTVLNEVYELAKARPDEPNPYSGS